MIVLNVSIATKQSKVMYINYLQDLMQTVLYEEMILYLPSSLIKKKSIHKHTVAEYSQIINNTLHIK